VKTFLYTPLILALVALAFAADHPDFTGTWKMEVSKTDDSNGPPPRITRRVSKDGNVITMTEIQYRDGRQSTVTRLFSTDGTVVRGKLGGQPIATRGRWDGDKLVSDTTIGDTNMLHEVWSLSEDGRTWTNEMVFDGHPSKTVFTRQYLP
jgi:hypothetical protein